MSFARIQAFLGLDISGFQSGLDKANRGAERFKQTLKAGDIKGGLKEALSAGAIIQGFREILQRAQDARDAAEKLGRTVDLGTASVARYADAWDRVKNAVGNTAVAGVGVLTRSGEAIGDFTNQLFAKARGMTPAQARRTSKISEDAERNAERLEAGKGDAKKRGDDKKKAQAEANKKAQEEREKVIRDGSEQFEKNRFNALPIGDQIKDLEKRRRDAIEARGGNSADGRAKARLEQYKIEGELAEKRKEQEKQINDLYGERAKAILKQAAEEKRAYEERAKRVFDAAKKQIEAERRVAEAKRELETKRRDAVAPSLSEVLGGKRGNSRDRARARQIERDEETARRLTDSGNRVSLFDEKTQRSREVGADFFQNRALSARAAGNFKSSDQNPLSDAEEKLKEAGEGMKEAASELRAAIEQMKTIEIDVESV